MFLRVAGRVLNSRDAENEKRTLMQPSPAATTFTLLLSFCLSFFLHASPPPSLPQCSPSTPKRLRLREVTRPGADTLQRGRRTRMPRLVGLPCADDLTEGGRGEGEGEKTGWCDTGETKDERVMLAEKYEALECIFDCALPPKMCGHACARQAPWLLTCCRCAGVLPCHQQGEDAPGSRNDTSTRGNSSSMLARFFAQHHFVPQGQHVHEFDLDVDNIPSSLSTYPPHSLKETAVHREGSIEQVSGISALLREHTHSRGQQGEEQQPREPRGKSATLCWMCRAEEQQPRIYHVLSSIIPAPSNEKEKMRPEISTEKASGGEGETEDEKWEAVVEGMQVDERMWEMIMRIAGELMGPWWLLRVIDSESSASSAFPLFLRFCAARDSVWYGVCKMEGLVGSRGHPRPPFHYRLLKAEREGERERGRQARERDKREREREREEEDDKEEEEGRGGCGDGGASHHYMWLHVYSASRKLGAAIRDVAERVRVFGGPSMLFNAGLSEHMLCVYEEALGLEIPYDMRLLYARIDGQEATAGDGILCGLRMLSLKELVTTYLQEQHLLKTGAATASYYGAHTRSEHLNLLEHVRRDVEEEEDVAACLRLPLSERVGFRRYVCAAHSGAIWLEGGFNFCCVAASLTEFLGSQPGSRMRTDLQRGSRLKHALHGSE